MTIQYIPALLPNLDTFIWIYGIVFSSNNYTIGSQYQVPPSEISITSLIQTYTIPKNLLQLVHGSYVGIGIKDSRTHIATTTGGNFFFWVNYNPLQETPRQGDILSFQRGYDNMGASFNFTIAV